jgi:FlgD Ig-like domain
LNLKLFRKEKGRHVVKYVAFIILLMLPYRTLAAEQYIVNRVMGLSAVGVSSCIAVWVPLADNEALNGIMWYNNDGTIVFPSILVGCGLEDKPGLMDEMFSVAHNVQGGSVQWSTQEFIEPIASSAGGLYVVMRLPFGSEQVDIGTGGGAGVGYSINTGGLKSWISWDGQFWMSVHNSVKVAIEPLIEDANSDTRLLGRDDKALACQVETAMIILTTKLNAPAPNPFNPQTSISFTLANEDNIELTVHDLRGAVVKRMAAGLFSAGPHELNWMGRDDENRRVGSGVYIVRLKTLEGIMTRQLVLLK